MKKNLFSTLFICLLVSNYSTAADIVLADFDGGTQLMEMAKWPTSQAIRQNPAIVTAYEIITNNWKEGNTSSHCMRAGQAANADWNQNWVGIALPGITNEADPCTDRGIPVTATNCYLKIMVLRNVNRVNFDVWVSTTEKPGTTGQSGTDSYMAYRGLVPSVSVWHDIVVDLTPIIGQHIRAITIINSDNWDTPRIETPVTNFYYDNFVLSDHALPRISPAAGTSITIDPTKTYQTIEGFSSSDAWAGDFVGKNFTAERDKVAKWLFDSSINSDGSVNGIGLSMWRFNLGAGSARQSNSGIVTATRRADSFITGHASASGSPTYDWNNRHAGQQWFLKKAYDYGVRNFVAFAVSPPVQYTANNRAFAAYGKAFGANLDWNSPWGSSGQSYSWSAHYWVRCLEHFQQTLGIPFRYLSPVNEPQWNWNADNTGTYAQEGSSWYNQEIAELCRYIEYHLKPANLPTKIFLGEAGNWYYVLDKPGEEAKAGNQIASFFWNNASNKNYIGNLTTLERCFTAHSYQTCANATDLKWYREEAKKVADYYKIKLHQTEWSMLEGLPQDAPFSVKNYSPSSYNDIALYMARVIHSDLAFADVSSWSYWTTMDVDAYGWGEDRFYLLAINPPYTGMTNQQLYDLNWTGTVTPVKTLWALGNYSLFIRPGYKRCDLVGASNLTGLMGTAYIAPNNSKLVVVYVNLTNSTQYVAHALKAIPGCKYTTIDIYQTDQTSDLKKMGTLDYTPGTSLPVGARSVTTIVYNLEYDTDITSNDIVLADFDGTSSNPMELAKWSDNKAIRQESMVTHYDIVHNGTKSGCNTSPYCMRTGQAKNADWMFNFTGIALPGITNLADPCTGRGIPITAANHYLKMLVLRECNITGFDIWITTTENPGGEKCGVNEAYHAYRGNVSWEDLGQWHDIVMDLSPLIGQHLRSVVIINSNNWSEPRIPTPATFAYYDNFVLSDNATPREMQGPKGTQVSINTEKEKESNLLTVFNAGKNTIDVITADDAKVTILNSMGQVVAVNQTRAGVPQQFNIAIVGMYIIIADTGTRKQIIKTLVM